MNLRRVTPPLLIALAVSGVCTLVLGRKIAGKAAPPPPALHYLAPSHALEAGEILRPDSMREIAWPASNPITGAFVRQADLVGRATLYPVDANQPFTAGMVSAPGAGIGLAGHIREGMRAIALRSDEVVGVAGFLLPGSHLDVLVTYHSDKSPDPRTLTVLQNAEVLATGHQIQPDPQGKPASVDVVTLLLSPADAERAVMASTQGTIHFVLRSSADTSRTEDGGIVLSQLGSPGDLTPLPQAAPARPRVVRPVSAPASPRPVRQATVQTISGDKQVTATFDEVAK